VGYNLKLVSRFLKISPNFSTCPRQGIGHFNVYICILWGAAGAAKTANESPCKAEAPDEIQHMKPARTTAKTVNS